MNSEQLTNQLNVLKATVADLEEQLNTSNMIQDEFHFELPVMQKSVNKFLLHISKFTEKCLVITKYDDESVSLEQLYQVYSTGKVIKYDSQRAFAASLKSYLKSIGWDGIAIQKGKKKKTYYTRLSFKI